jgi:hypothetical protein
MTETEKAIKHLEEQGYAVQNLWHISDVISFDKRLKREQCKSIIDDALISDSVVDAVLSAILYEIESDKMSKTTIFRQECNVCGHNNHKDSFNCVGEDCGAPLDLEITINDLGLPEIN